MPTASARRLLGLSCVFAALATQGAILQAAPLPTTPAQWSTTARSDIEAAYRTLRDNHPGMIDPANPGFAAQLDRARAEGLRFAARVTDGGGFTYALSAFSAALRDGHAGAFADLPNAASPPVRWPGFVTVWRGTGLYVYASEPGGPSPGTRISACDGVPIDQLIRANIFRFGDRPDEAGQWWVKARRVLTDLGNPFVRPPRNCKITIGKTTQTIALTWKGDTEQAQGWRTQSYNGDTLPLGLSEPQPGLYWIALPTFDPDAADVARYDTLYAALDKQRPVITGARAVVLDLRQNQGGSSDWSLHVAQRLWGKTRVDAAMRTYEAGIAVHWRATPGNLDGVREQVESIRRDGDAAGAEERSRIADGIAGAIRSKAAVFDEPPQQADDAPAPGETPPLAAPVYVVVPGQCASACLDALDIFTRFPGVTLIGAPSSGDSTYMDIRVAPLPSGLGSIVIPMKSYAGRPRRSGQIYRPAIEVDDLDWSTTTFIARINQDLERRTPSKN